MTVQSSHTFVDGASILGAQLAHCDHCKTLRVTDPARHAQPRYLRRSTDEGDRDSQECPPCISPDEANAATRARVESMNRARAREQAVRVAVRDAPADQQPHFPWFST